MSVVYSLGAQLRKFEQQCLEQQLLVRVGVECFERSVDALDRVRRRFRSGDRAVDKPVTVRAGEGGQACAQLVDAMTAEFTLVPFLQRLLATTPFAQRGNPLLH